MKSVLTLFCALGALALASPASAQTGSKQDASKQDAPFDFGPKPGWQVLFGPTGGGSFGSPGGGGFAGAELSVSRLDAGWWQGAYVDGVYDFGQSAALVTAGPQLGYTLLGVDGGVAARFGDDGPDWGPQARLMFSAGFFSLYGRYAYLLDSDEHVGQAGVMFKLPLWADD
ncbi:hypothetical protein FIV42_01080 [Persicimonas caeni]|uniref:Adventurous gliding motility protein CglE n=1 Tax=Persicimonas caeni TaxID=2292766 RepID=A0A4Y6PM32_PERCE|nr:hypothetical protein [Persicimonas caeni]QDG49376.1 hypothetical protein FIV42_01080 [Persicimonas caeni]QED30597.1 hypothetical protein FRD00_01075 [Persicimonas caeni]